MRLILRLIIVPCMALSSCTDRDEVLYTKLDGTWTLNQIKVYRPYDDSIATFNSATINFNSCDKKESPCDGWIMIGTEKYRFEFQVSNPKNASQRVSMTFLNIKSEDYKKYDWSGPYDLRMSEKELILECAGCALASRHGGSMFEIKATR